MQQQTKQTYEFGPFRLDPMKRVLLKDGEAVPLTPKAFDVLLLLVESHGDIVAKGAAMDHLWADSFVEDGNLTVYISILRKALGENPGQHRYIVTEPGRGYRFVADVREIWGDQQEIILEQHESARLIIHHEQS